MKIKFSSLVTDVFYKDPISLAFIKKSVLAQTGSKIKVPKVCQLILKVISKIETP